MRHERDMARCFCAAPPTIAGLQSQGVDQGAPQTQNGPPDWRGYRVAGTGRCERP